MNGGIWRRPRLARAAWAAGPAAAGTGSTATGRSPAAALGRRLRSAAAPAATATAATSPVATVRARLIASASPGWRGSCAPARSAAAPVSLAYAAGSVFVLGRLQGGDARPRARAAAPRARAISGSASAPRRGLTGSPADMNSVRASAPSAPGWPGVVASPCRRRCRRARRARSATGRRARTIRRRGGAPRRTPRASTRGRPCRCRRRRCDSASAKNSPKRVWLRSPSVRVAVMIDAVLARQRRRRSRRSRSPCSRTPPAARRSRSSSRAKSARRQVRTRQVEPRLAGRRRAVADEDDEHAVAGPGLRGEPRDRRVDGLARRSAADARLDRGRDPRRGRRCCPAAARTGPAPRPRSPPPTGGTARRSRGRRRARR